MYLISSEQKKIKKVKISDLEGFIFRSKSKKFNIKGVEIKDIEIMDKKLAHAVVSKKVMNNYKKLLDTVTELLVSDEDDSADTCHKALDQIERFRVQVKNKYRKYLKKQELEMMSKQLLKLKKEAEIKLNQLNKHYENVHSSKRSR